MGISLFRFFGGNGFRKLALSILVITPFFLICTRNGGNNKNTPFEVSLIGTGERKSFSDAFEVKVGQQFVVRYTGEFSNCDSCEYEWKMGENVLGTSLEQPFVFCKEGEYSVGFKVKSEGEEKQSMTFKVVVQPQQLSRPAEIQAQIDIYKNEVFIIGTDQKKTQEALSKIANSVLKLEDYVRKQNSCDVEAIYALSLGKVVGILAELKNLW